MKTTIFLISLFPLALSACSGAVANNNTASDGEAEEQSLPEETKSASTEVYSGPAFKINKEGKTIAERFVNLDPSYERDSVEKGSYAEWLLNLPLKPYGSVTHYYNGEEKYFDCQVGVIDMKLVPENEDVMQCADAAMRLRAEYLYAAKKYSQIHFNFTNGFCCDYSKWASGDRVHLKGNKSWWSHDASEDYSYKTFCKYLRMVFYLSLIHI